MQIAIWISCAISFCAVTTRLPFFIEPQTTLFSAYGVKTLWFLLRLYGSLKNAVGQVLSVLYYIDRKNGPVSCTLVYPLGEWIKLIFLTLSVFF